MPFKGLLKNDLYLDFNVQERASEREDRKRDRLYFYWS